MKFFFHIDGILQENFEKKKLTNMFGSKTRSRKYNILVKAALQIERNEKNPWFLTNK